MLRMILPLCLAAVTAVAQDYKLDKASAPPGDLPPAIAQALAPDGAKVVGPSGPVCEIWWRKDIPQGKVSEENVSFTDIAHGTLMGVIRYLAPAQDRRGQKLNPGVYTMRLSFFPVDGAHQGVSQTRDFLLLTPAAEDTDVNATPTYAQLVAMSKKAAGTNHPAVLNVWKSDSAGPAELKKEGEDWILTGTAGGRPVSLIVIGVHQG